jgi:uncharacterized protein YjbI with pentapeptide repeats
MPNQIRHPNEVADVRISQAALGRLSQFHMAYMAGRPGGRRAVLRRCSLAGLDLSHMDFSDAIFIDCDFQAIQAGGAKFIGAVLRNARFAQADLTAADFARADLDGASFQHARRRVALRKLQPSAVAQMVRDHAIWVKSQGRAGARADFSGVDLAAANFSGRNLCLADFSGALLADAQMKSALLIAADFRGANLTRANLRAADLRGANFLESHRRDIDLTDSTVGSIPGLSLATRGLA